MTASWHSMVSIRSVAIALLLSVALAPGAFAASTAEKKADVDKMAQDTLQRLYAVQPAAKKAIKNAAGYAVFSAFGAKIMIAGGGSGSGVAAYKGSGQKVYMKMAEVQAGLGFGVKKFRLVWVFEKKADLDSFVNSGWELGAQTSVAAKVGSQGGAFAGAMSIKPGVWLYQLTDDGLALELTAKGTKYYKDTELN
ncbi:MAG: YSC84-related protein [Steroidobacteraceae bacterium]|jgi:lipid-binding SYLF domain-containing protein|nr:YSC84-related protein [Steroidobacteraceae bacterium]